MRNDTGAPAAPSEAIASRRPKRKAAEIASAELTGQGKGSRSSSGATQQSSANSSQSAAKTRRASGRGATQRSSYGEDSDRDMQASSDEEGATRRNARTGGKSAASKTSARAQASNDGAEEEEFSESSEDVDNDDDADADFGGGRKGRSSARQSRNAKSTTARKAGQATAGNSTKKAKKTTTSSRPQTASKGRAPPQAAGAGRQGSGAKSVARNKEHLPIKEDNVIFNAVKDPDSALDTAAEDWVAMYHDAPAKALAQMVTFLLRCAACNEEVDQQAVEDQDQVVDKVEELQNAARKESMPSYPLVSKAPEYKRFRQSLSEFFGQLLASAHESEALFDDTCFDTLKSWIVAMSAASLRAFRHTATVQALILISALNDVLAQVRNALAAAVRQRDTERKKGRNDKARLREMERKVQEQKDFEAILKSHREDLFNSVFVHRYRDADLNIRCDCVSELGVWMKKHPDYYMNGTCFTYMGWLLSDAEAPVRLSCVQALHALYSKSNITGPLRHFTDRFKDHLTDMVVGDEDIGVRCTTLTALAALDKSAREDGEDEDSILVEAQKEAIGLQLFNTDARLRKASAPFVSATIEHLVEAGLKELEDDADTSSENDLATNQSADHTKLRFKAMAMLLVKLSNVLDTRLRGDDNEATVNEDEAVQQAGWISGELARLGRIAVATRSLWDVNDHIHEVQPLIELLGLDHSYDTQASQSARIASDAISLAPSHLKLSAEEETVLLEVLVTLVCKIKESVAVNVEHGTIQHSEVTRTLIEAMPRLFAKYRTDATRIKEVLRLPQLLKLDEYLELNGLTAFAALWDDIIDQFARHIEPDLLGTAVCAMRALHAAKGLGETSVSKLSKVHEQVLSALRTAAQDLDLEQDDLSESQVATLSACVLRLRTLASSFDNMHVMESDNGGKLSTGWDLALALASRGRVGSGRANEGDMVHDALQMLYWYLVWTLRQLRGSIVVGSVKQAALDSFIDKRKTLIGLMSGLVGAPSAAGVVLRVQRAAFERLIQLHILFAPRKSTATSDEDAMAKAQLASSLEVGCSPELQERCVKFVESDLWRFSFSLAREKADHRRKYAPTDASASDGNGDDSSMIDVHSSDIEDGDEQPATKKAGTRGGSQASDSDLPPFNPSSSLLKRELEFGTVVATLINAVRCGIFDAKHTGVLLKHYGRLGQAFDACMKVLVDVLREVALRLGQPTAVCDTVLRALEEAFDMYLAEGKRGSDATFLALCRAISSIIVMRGRNLAVIRAVPPSALVRLHVGGIKHAVLKAQEGAQQDIDVSTKRAPVVFRGLVYMMASMRAGEALKIKTDMDKLIQEAQLDTATKAWDPQRTYEKRLLGIVAKNQGTRITAQAAQQQAAVAPTPAPRSEAGGSAADPDAEKDAAGDDDEETHNVDLSLATAKAVSAGPSRPKARQFSRQSKRTAADLDSEDGGDGAEHDNDGTPRRRSSAFGTGAGPLSILADDDEETGAVEDDEQTSPSSSAANKENARPSSGSQAARKRQKRV